MTAPTAPPAKADPASLPPTHLLIGLAVVAVWGSNFVVIKAALGHLPPLLFAFLRFGLAALPALFVPRPKVAWRNLAAYGLLIGAGQFGLLFIAMGRDISPGLASLVVQSQVFFTIGLAAILAGERVRGHQIAGLVLGAAGIGLIAMMAKGAATPLGLALTLIAALSWAGGNLVARAAGPVNMIGYIAWASLFSAPPLLAASLLLEGLPRIETGLTHADWTVWAAVLWQTIGNTMFGYGLWGWLLARHPAATVAPMALAVPVFGMATAAVVMAEPLPAWKLAAAGLVLGGLAVNLLWPKVVGWMGWG